MSLLRNLIGGLRALLRPSTRNAEIQEELRTFVESSIADKIRNGMPPEEAERAARREVGSAETVRVKANIGCARLRQRKDRDIGE